MKPYDPVAARHGHPLVSASRVPMVIDFDRATAHYADGRMSRINLETGLADHYMLDARLDSNWARETDYPVHADRASLMARVGEWAEANQLTEGTTETLRLFVSSLFE